MKVERRVCPGSFGRIYSEGTAKMFHVKHFRGPFAEKSFTLVQAARNDYSERRL
jgi:hypothetical protein